jgi:cytochrome c oxidase subunit 4
MSDSHSQSHGAADSHDHDGHDVAKDVRKYVLVFVALIIGTIFTVWASTIRFPSHSMNIAVALVIASVKVFLVAGFFMHLISEKKLIYSIMAVTVFFFIGLMYLTIWSMKPLNLIHIGM